MLVFCQIVDDKGTPLSKGTEGNIGIRVKPDKPFSLFTEYTVSTMVGLVFVWHLDGCWINSRLLMLY